MRLQHLWEFERVAEGKDEMKDWDSVTKTNYPFEEGERFFGRRTDMLRITGRTINEHVVEACEFAR